MGKARPCASGSRTTSRSAQPAPAHRPDGGAAETRRVDPGAQRGRGAHARVQPHQAAPPRFNIRLRDDKSYPFLAVTLDDEWPRAMVMRGASARACATSARTPTPTRSARRSTCCCARSRSGRAATASSTHQRLGRPCLLFHIEKCSGPCVGEIDKEAYDRLVEELLGFLDGDTEATVRRLTSDMRRGGGRASSSSGRLGCAIA